VTQSTDVPDGFTYSCSINDAADMRCTVELPGQGIAGEFYNGSTWTLSFYARSTGADLSYTPSMNFVNGPSYAAAGTSWSSSNNSITITSTWQRFEIQYTVNDAPTNSHYAVGFVLGGTAGRSIRFTGIQLESGSTATPFEHRSYGEEFALCQRYYEELPQSFFDQEEYVSSAGFGIRRIVPYKVTKRAIPTITAPNRSASQSANADSYTSLIEGVSRTYSSSASGNAYVFYNSRLKADSEL
jgi:hypothetical protein